MYLLIIQKYLIILFLILLKVNVPDYVINVIIARKLVM